MYNTQNLFLCRFHRLCILFPESLVLSSPSSLSYYLQHKAVSTLGLTCPRFFSIIFSIFTKVVVSPRSHTYVRLLFREAVPTSSVITVYQVVVERVAESQNVVAGSKGLRVK